MLIDRLFTTPAFDESRLQEAVLADLGTQLGFESQAPKAARFATRRCRTAGGITEVIAPESWSLEAVRAFADNLFDAAPCKRVPIEENTMPSWLWRKRADGTETRTETHVNEVLDRVTASACHKGWKLGLWRDESEAAAFYDEAHFLLSARMIALEPGALRALGLDWAYGIAAAPQGEVVSKEGREGVHDSRLPLGNATIDGIFGPSGTQESAFWEKLLRDSREKNALAVRFTDTEKEWNAAPSPSKTPRGALNLGAFLDNYGDVDVFKLRHATRVLTLLLELHYETLAPLSATRDLEIGFTNLATLLMRLGLAYDSRTGRATAAALAAIISAEAAATSAQLAAVFGPAPAYMAQRDSALRLFRNLRRAAYDEETDYERLSIVPQRLDIESGAHLVLIATARRRWDEAYELIQKHGVRHLRLTGCFESPELATALDALSDGFAPLAQLVTERANGDDEDTAAFHRVLHEDVLATLQAQRFDAADLQAAVAHATGYGTLKAAPGLCLADLRDKGFDDEALGRIEAALAEARNLKTVFTPWVLGRDFCEKALGLSAAQIEDPAFDLLAHLGFSRVDIARAEAFCFGHDTICGMAELSTRAASVFLTASDISMAARMKMAASVQSFLMHDVGLRLELSATASTETRAQTILSAWQFGLRSVALAFQKETFFALSGAQPPSFPTNPTQEARKSLLGKKKGPQMPEPHAPLAVQRAVSGVVSASSPSLSPSLGKTNKPRATLGDIAVSRPVATKPLRK